MVEVKVDKRVVRHEFIDTQVIIVRNCKECPYGSLDTVAEKYCCGFTESNFHSWGNITDLTDHKKYETTIPKWCKLGKASVSEIERCDSKTKKKRK